MRKTLKNLKDTRDLTDESVEYAIDHTLCLNGVDRKVYHCQCLIGPQIQKLLANGVQIIDQLETEFLRVREQNSIKNPTTNLASIEEIKKEMNFFRIILHCYDCDLINRDFSRIRGPPSTLGAGPICPTGNVFWLLHHLGTNWQVPSGRHPSKSGLYSAELVESDLQ
jgi:hypothetical protein